MKPVPIAFLYFAGCPNSEPSFANLKAAIAELNLDVELSVIEVKDSRQAAEVGFLGSPSILVAGRDLETGRPPEGSSFSCRIYDIEGRRTGRLPKEYIKARLSSLS
ncbi:MAG: hypothetical protein QHH01_06660 [Spirochaetales bacterium]|nr:hypothetical protein [Spirochaetales bacterium]